MPVIAQAIERFLFIRLSYIRTNNIFTGLLPESAYYYTLILQLLFELATATMIINVLLLLKLYILYLQN